MLKKRFFISWIFASLIMAVASFVWHGLILNDLQFVPRPIEIFYLLAALVYVVIGFTLTFVYTYLSMGLGIKLKGFLMGMALGFFIYLIAFVLGISFKGSGTAHLMVDFLWQMLEQGFGGATIAGIYYLAKRRDLFFAE